RGSKSIPSWWIVASGFIVLLGIVWAYGVPVSPGSRELRNPSNAVLTVHGREGDKVSIDAAVERTLPAEIHTRAGLHSVMVTRSPAHFERRWIVFEPGANELTIEIRERLGTGTATAASKASRPEWVDRGSRIF